MTGVIIGSALFMSGFLSAQNPPTNLQAEQATNPTTVTDHRPDFRAQSNSGSPAATRFQIQVSTDPSFATVTHWNSPDPNGGTNFPGNVNVGNTVLSPEIPYGQGAANLLTVPLLDWNTTYFWRTRFGRNTAASWSNFSANAQFTMAAPTRAISQHSNNGSSSGSSFRMIGVPIAFGTTVPASELLTEVPLLYRLDEATRTYTQLTASDVLEGGRGYFGWCDASTVLTLSQGKVTAGIPAVKNGAGATTTPSYVFNNTFSYTTLGAPTGQEITDGVPANEYRGNHLFANPFYAPISWRSSVNGPTLYGHVARAGISFAMYKWDGTQYLTYNGVTHAGTAGEWIEPFQAVGIWVQSASHILQIDTPAPLTGGAQKARLAASAAPTPPAPDPNSWHLRIEARSGAAIDTENAFGISTEADDAWDVRDSEEPGAGSATWLTVAFDHRSDWTTNPRKYTHDFRKTPLKAGDVVTWTFTVDGNTGLPATLTWPNLGDIPAGDWSFALEDPATSTTVNLGSTASYDTPAVNGPSTLILRATRLTDAPVAPASSGGGGGGSCGLLGLEGLLLAGWILFRRGCRLMDAA